MQEESDPVSHRKASQLLRQRDQMVVVHPDQVVGLQDGGQRRGEAPIDRAVTTIILAPIGHQAETEMQQRPQGTIGEADVEGAVLGLRHIDRGIGDAVRLGELRRLGRGLHPPSAPAEPQRSALQRIGQRHRQTSGARPALRRQRDPVGDDYEARHNPSSHERDRRIAATISPTWE